MKKSLLITFLMILLFSCAAPEKKIEETVFYPDLPQRPRIQFLTSITNEDDLGKKQGAFKEWLLGEKPSTKNIERPYDIGAANGKIYISDRLHRKILIIDLKKREFDYIHDRKQGAMGEPAGIWITSDDYKYVSDFKRKQILVYDNNNQFVRAYGEKEQLEKPVDVAVYSNKIYVSDFDKHEILVLDKDSGQTIQTIGGIGQENGKLYKPTYLTIDRNGDIYVTDSFNFRLQVFNQEGVFVKTIGFHGDRVGAFTRPKGLGVDNEEEIHIYAADAAFENVQLFDAASTNLLLPFGGFGNEPGNMYLPWGVHIDYANVEYFNKYADKNFRLKYLIYVGNNVGTHKINVYGYGDWIGEPIPEPPKNK